MAWLKSLTQADLPQVECDLLVLRIPQRSDFAQWHALRSQSRAFLTPWEPSWGPNELTKASFEKRVRRFRKNAAAQTGFTFFLFEKNADGSRHLRGGLSVSNIRRGAMHACNMGYWVGAPHARTGLTTKSVALAKPFIFGELKLHRIESAIIPTNIASRRVLEKNHFVHEGAAEKYLFINGKWQDHLLFGLSRERYYESRVN